MIDVFNIADDSAKKQVFYAVSSGSTQWQTWQKPNGAKMVHIYILGGGGGGGSGRTGGINTGGGGGGGGSTAISIGLFPACMLPDILYVSVGKGGTGGVSNTFSVLRRSSWGSYIVILKNSTFLSPHINYLLNKLCLN